MKEPKERIVKARQLRILARGYAVLKKDKAGAYEAAAQALELVEERSGKDEVRTKDAALAGTDRGDERLAQGSTSLDG